MNLEKDEVTSNQVYTKVLSTDDTCYLIYRKTRVTTLGLDNKYVGISKYRESIYPGMHMGAVLRDICIATSAHSYTILEGSEKEFVSVYRYLCSVLRQKLSLEAFRAISYIILDLHQKQNTENTTNIIVKAVGMATKRIREELV